MTYCVNHLHLQYSTIKLYLCCIRYNYLVKTRETIFETSALPRVQAALTGIKRLQGVCTSFNKTHYKTVLKKYISSLSMGLLDSYTSLMLKAEMTTAFFGFLRGGEFTIDQVYNKHVHLSLQDLVFYQDRTVGWLVCFGFNGPLRQYFSLYRAVSKREGERGKKG